MNPSPDPRCVNHVADMITDMVFDGMKDLPEEEQNRRLTAFCESVSSQLHSPASTSESA